MFYFVSADTVSHKSNTITANVGIYLGIHTRSKIDNHLVASSVRSHVKREGGELCISAF